MQGSKEQTSQKSAVLRVDQEQQEFVFTDIANEPVPSLLRDFSAPVKMEVKGQTDDDLIFLLAHDTGMPTALPYTCTQVSSVCYLLAHVPAHCMTPMLYIGYLHLPLHRTHIICILQAQVLLA